MAAEGETQCPEQKHYEKGYHMHRFQFFDSSDLGSVLFPSLTAGIMGFLKYFPEFSNTPRKLVNYYYCTGTETKGRHSDMAYLLLGHSMHL